MPFHCSHSFEGTQPVDLLSPASTLTTSTKSMLADSFLDNIPESPNTMSVPVENPPSLAPSSPGRSSHASSISSHGHEELAMFNLVTRQSSPMGKRYRNYFVNIAHDDDSSLSTAVPKEGGGGFDLVIPCSRHLSNSPGKSDFNEDVHPHRRKMKKNRKHKAVAGAVGGMVIGGLSLGPVGVFVGAALGGVTTRHVAKKVEKRAQRKHEKKSFQRAANRFARHWEHSGGAAFA